MRVAMMNIRKMRMVMPNRQMLMCMTVRNAGRLIPDVLMLMMLVMNMTMGVLQRLVLMGVVMRLGQVQPHADYHERRGQPEQPRHRFSQHQNRDACPQERRR